MAINKNHLTRLAYVDEARINKKSKRVGVYVWFDDGNIITVASPLRKYFFREAKAELENALEMQFEDITEEVRQENELNQ